MNQPQTTAEMLELIVQPAFCVQDGVITQINKAAAGRLIRTGTEIAPLLCIGREEYAAFQEGCLYLTLELSGVRQEASVRRIGSQDIFILEQQAQQPELQAMALASQALREPMSALMISTGRLFARTSGLQDPAADYDAAAVSRAQFQILRMLGNMSDALRYLSGTPVYQVRDAAALLEDIFDRLADLTSSRSITLRFSGLPQAVYTLVDSEKLERAVGNMISNSMKAMPDGGEIDARLTRQGSRLYLTIEDSGCGIDPARRGGIHCLYLREPGLESSTQGIGLGLVLIRAAAAAHGGTLLMENPKGRGLRSTFTMEIRQDAGGTLRSPTLQVDYAGEWDHGLLELSDVLPVSVYRKNAEKDTD